MVDVQKLLNDPRFAELPPDVRERLLRDALPATQTPFQRLAGTPEQQRASTGYLGMLPGFEFMGLLPQAQQEAVATGLPEGARTATATGLGIAGSAGGAVAGAALGGPAGAALGEMGGSFAARKANVALGLEDPGTLGDVLSVAVPGVTRAYQAVKPALVKHLPGAQTVLHEEGLQALQRLPEGIGPPVPSEDLYAAVTHAGNPAIRAEETARAASLIHAAEQQLGPGLKQGKILTVAQNLKTLVKDGAGEVPLDALKARQQRVGLLLAEAKVKNWPQVSALKRLYGSISDDLEAAASRKVPGAAELSAANAAFKQEQALKDLGEMFAPGQRGLTTRPDGLIQINAGVLKDRFEKALLADKNFRNGLGADLVGQVRETLTDLQRLPRMPAPHGQAVGSALVLGRGTGASGLTYALTGSPELAALAGSVAAAGPQALGWFFTTDTGRAWLKHQMASQGGVSPTALAALGSLARQTFGASASEPPIE